MTFALIFAAITVVALAILLRDLIRVVDRLEAVSDALGDDTYDYQRGRRL